MCPTKTAIPLPDAFEYSIWLSYAEVYNEKIYDLLDLADKRKPLSLKTDRQTGAKYVHGLKEERVVTIEQAMDLLARGQTNRQVFSTLLNGASSRSHGIFTIRVVRLPKGVQPDDDSVGGQLSRMCIVDLAGSERNRNTHTQGDRLKEAGSINKSLMVLGQCLDVMRRNQQEQAKGRKVSILRDHGR